MQNKYTIIIWLLFTILFVQVGKAQENITMYNMLTLPQTAKLNPAHQIEYKGHLGGLITVITPVLGQITPNIDLNIHSSFPYSDFIYKGTGVYRDSLVFAFNTHDGALKLIDKLDKISTLGYKMNLNILNFGFRTDRTYWNVNLTNRTFLNTTIPKGLVELMVKGNGSPDISENVDLSGLGLSCMNYNEVGVGTSVEVLSELRLGARVKLLSGIANMEIVKSDLNLATLENELVLDADLEMRASQPAYILEDLYYDYKGDSLVFETKELEKSEIISNLSNVFANPGLAIDLGAEYQVDSKLRVSASITDLGFISWRTNVAEVSGGGKFRFDGIDAVEYIDDYDENTDESDYGEIMKDSLIKVFDVKKGGGENYKTWLPTNVYMGGAYSITDAIGLGALYRGVIYNGNLNSAFSISANANTRHISASISYTIMKNNFDNIGIGFSGRFGPFQMYIISDHVLEAFLPQDANDLNLRMGVNWIFGYKNKCTEALVK